MQRIHKLIADNPNVVIGIIVVLALIVTWLYIKSINISPFTNKKENSKGNKLFKGKLKDDVEVEVEEKKEQNKKDIDKDILKLISSINS